MTSMDTAMTDKAPAPVLLPEGAATEGARREREQQRKRARILRRAGWAMLAVATSVGVAFALRPEAIPVDVAQVERGPLLVAVEESGVTRVRDRYTVSAPLGGELARIWLEPGDEIQKGDTIAHIAAGAPPLLDERSRAEARARLRAAVAALGQARAQQARAATAKELAERDLTRDTMLALKGSIAPQGLDRTAFDARLRADELESASFGVSVAEEEVRQARVVLERASEGVASTDAIAVPSPVPGNILRVVQRSAGAVSPGTPLVEVGDLGELEIVVDLLTTDAVQVEPGATAEIFGWGSERTLHAEVLRIEPSAFTKPSALGVDEQRVNVVLALTDPRPAWLALGDGYRVQARIPLWKANNVPKVPLGALFRYGEGWAVFRVDGDVARLTPVEIGHRGETDTEILSGVDVGTRVAVHPGDRVKDGARLEAKE
jgi:HlyD family secretion protein